jgi:hypothetical protein
MMEFDQTTVKRYAELVRQQVRGAATYFDNTPVHVLRSGYLFYETYHTFPPAHYPEGLDKFMDIVFEEKERSSTLDLREKKAEVVTLGVQGLDPMEIAIMTSVRMEYVKDLLRRQGLLEEKTKKPRKKKMKGPDETSATSANPSSGASKDISKDACQEGTPVP